MQTILNSEAFESLDGRTKLQGMLDAGNQIAVRNALNQMLEQKIVEYSSIDGDAPDSLKLGERITLSFADEQEVTEAAVKSEQ